MVFMTRFKALFTVIRPLNCIFTVFTVLLGSAYLNENIINVDLFKILSVCLSAFFIAAAGYTINDVFDIEIDRINRPDRVLPSGKLSLDYARGYGHLLFLTGLIFAGFSGNIFIMIIALFNSISLYFYALRFKKSFLTGNMIVAWNACSTFVYGSLLTNNLKNIFSLVMISFLYTLLREWVKVVEDYEGDKKMNAKTIAVIYGKAKTIQVSYVPAILMMLSFFIMFQYKMISPDIFLLLNVLVTVPVFVFFYILRKSLHKQIVCMIQKYMKINMLIIVLMYMINDVIKIRI